MTTLSCSSSSQLQRFLLTKLYCGYGFFHKSTKNNNNIRVNFGGGTCCSAIAIDAPSAFTGVSSIKWGSTQLQGVREEMEDDLIIVQSDDLNGFSYAAVFDGHAGFSSVQFLRNELYKECISALRGGDLLNRNDFGTVKKALEEAFQNADIKLLSWLESNGEEDDESGTTATVILVGNDVLFISHVGDSCLVLSRSGKPEVLTNSHRPYGNNKTSLQEIRRINEAGGWIVNGRICGDIAVSRSFGDMRFKTKKYEMLEKGVQGGRWSEKFISRIQFKGDLVSACPDVSQVYLGKDEEFLILASDGLWDYISSSEAVDFVRNQLKQHGDVQVASEALAQKALDQKSQDNISIIIADFGRTDWRNLPQKKDNIVLELGQALITVGFVSVGIWMSSLLNP